MDAAGLDLLARVESLMREMVESQKLLVTALSRHNEQEESLARLRRASAARTARSRAKRTSRDSAVTALRDSNVTRQVFKEVLEIKKEKKKEPAPVTSPLRDAGDHPALIAHFAATLKRLTEMEYRFKPEDGKHVRGLLDAFGLEECRRLVDLAAHRYQSEPFWRNKGLTLRRVANDADELRTARPRQAPAMNGDSEALKRYALEHPELNDDEVLEGWHRQRAVP
jgi:hypothetical protein